MLAIEENLQRSPGRQRRSVTPSIDGLRVDPAAGLIRARAGGSSRTPRALWRGIRMNIGTLGIARRMRRTRAGWRMGEAAEEATEPMRLS